MVDVPAPESIPDPDGKVIFTVGNVYPFDYRGTFTGKNVNRDRKIGPEPDGDGNDDDNEVSLKATIAAKYEMDDIPPGDPSLGIPGGNSSTYYPGAIHRPVSDGLADYKRFIG